MVATGIADSGPYIIESDVYGLMTEFCSANVAIDFQINNFDANRYHPFKGCYLYDFTTT